MRKYIPSVGSKVKFQEFSDYSQKNVSIWAWMKVLEVNVPENEVTLQVLNGSQETDTIIHASLDIIEPPIGWKERYTIYVSPEKLEEVLSWLPRGIAVRVSHYIGDNSMTFQPLDNSEQPNWRYPEMTDVISPEDTKDLIRVVKLETNYSVGLPAPCKYCINGKRTRENNPALLYTLENIEHCELCGCALHFSFDEKYHDRPQPYQTHKKEEYCKNVKQPGECFVCNGTGKGLRYLSDMEPKEKKEAKKQLESEGWKITYERRGEAGYIAHRETVVKNWGE